MSNILAVFGATGKQGGSVVNYVLNDPELSKKFKIRAITRDVNSEKSKKLGEKVEVVQGDVADRASLETALTNVHTVFIMTTPFLGPDGVGIEYNNAKRIADAAVAKGAEYLIFSTLPSIKALSGNKVRGLVSPFDEKADAEKYMRGLPIKSAYFAAGLFMSNFQEQPFLTPRQSPDGTAILSLHVPATTKLPLIDAIRDTGKFVGAILAEPDKYQGKTFCAATAMYTFEDVVSIMSKVTGKTVVYKQVSEEEFKKNMPWGAEMFAQFYDFINDPGYFGPDTEKLVAWAAENARGKLHTFEEYLQAYPIQFL
ncbi:hypothetical protein GGS26DRAFT_562967 [Hypomontagnella submonticulosa]|nr:hypothetical protein GGS26DRAFT_562967 [Hypomontagnella submonticulosa]